MNNKNHQMICDILPLLGNLVLDVGCGDGALVRLMTREGAQVIGLDNNPVQLTKARASEAAGDETYMEGVGQDLPLVRKSIDIVVMFNSLHHIPVPDQSQALKEAYRVLQTNGLLAVFEPIAEGPHFKLNEPVDDETFVRAAAHRAIKQAPKFKFKEVRESTYDNIVTYANFAAFRDRCLRIDPSRKDAFHEHEEELRHLFDSLGSVQENGFGFVQPMRVNLLRK